MRLLYVLAILDAHQLRHQAVKNIFVVFSLVSILVVKQTEFEQFRVGKIIEREQVGTSLLKRRAVLLQCIVGNTRQEFPRSMSKTLVKVGVHIVDNKEIFIHQVACLLIDYKLLVESVAVRSLVVSLRDVFKRHRFGTVGCTNPVCIWQVDADRR